MKYIYLIITILLVSTYSCNAQAQLNSLTKAEYYGITIDGVTFRSIYDTNADFTQMKTLFGNDLVFKANTTGPSLGKDFRNNNIYFNFEDDSDVGNNYNLTKIEITNSSISIIVKGITVKLGDDKSVFGANPIINTNRGDNSVVFSSGLSESMAFKIDLVTNKIIEIEFNAF